jgi:hypothetical protein
MLYIWKGPEVVYLSYLRSEKYIESGRTNGGVFFDGGEDTKV